MADDSIAIGDEQQAERFVSHKAFIKIIQSDLSFRASGIYINSRQSISVASLQVGVEVHPLAT